MKTALELLDAAPDEQVVRMRIVFKAIAEARWEDAGFTLLNAASETTGQFSADCRELASYCNSQVSTA